MTIKQYNEMLKDMQAVHDYTQKSHAANEVNSIYMGTSLTGSIERKLLCDLCLALEDKHPDILDENPELKEWWKQTKEKHQEYLRQEENKRTRAQYNEMKIKVNGIKSYGGIVPEAMQEEYDRLCAKMELINEVDQDRTNSKSTGGDLLKALTALEDLAKGHDRTQQLLTTKYTKKGA